MTLDELKETYLSLKKQFHSNAIKQADVEYYILALEQLLHDYLVRNGQKVE